MDVELAAAGHYAGATLTLARHGNADADDHFSATGNLSFIGADIVLSGVVVGTLTTAGGILAITFNADATPARVNETMRSLAYSSSSATSPRSVMIDWTFADGNGGAQGSGGPLSVTGSTSVGIRNYTHLDIVTSDFNAGADVSLNQGDGTFLPATGVPMGGTEHRAVALASTATARLIWFRTHTKRPTPSLASTPGTARLDLPSPFR